MSVFQAAFFVSDLLFQTLSLFFISKSNTGIIQIIDIANVYFFFLIRGGDGNSWVGVYTIYEKGSFGLSFNSAIHGFLYRGSSVLTFFLPISCKQFSIRSSAREMSVPAACEVMRAGACRQAAAGQLGVGMAAASGPCSDLWCLLGKELSCFYKDEHS